MGVLARRAKKGLLIAAGVVGILALVGGGAIVWNIRYAHREARAVERAGFVERVVEIDGSTLNYAEGPAHGPPLVLVHGQLTDWRNWSRALPALSRHFHVFAVDCYGHGKSAHAAHKYTANALASDLRRFIEEVVGGPALVAGHSSGGLVAAVLAAEAAEWVTGVVLEDPPFFSSLLPRAEKTFNYVDLATTAHDFLQSGEADFTRYYVRHAVMWKLFQGAEDWIRGQALRYRERHPDEPLRLYFMPPSINEMFRGMQTYDPRFGAAFFDGSFHDGFDHADVLSRISVPASLIHANWSYDEDGVLLAAMDAEDAERTRALIEGVTLHRVDTGHGFHFEAPDEMVRITLELAARTSPEP